MLLGSVWLSMCVLFGFYVGFYLLSILALYKFYEDVMWVLFGFYLESLWGCMLCLFGLYVWVRFVFFLGSSLILLGF